MPTGPASSNARPAVLSEPLGESGLQTLLFWGAATAILSAKILTLSPLGAPPGPNAGMCRYPRHPISPRCASSVLWTGDTY